ncbi:MAG: hypothetical protein AB7D43_03375 [Sulfurimonadaceae bacterium]
MDECNGASRFPSVSLEVILTQTDTTVGFLSQDSQKLYEIKSRVSTKPFLKVYGSFRLFLSHKNRVPHAMKSQVRRSKKTTYIVKNRAFRVARVPLASSVLRKNDWCFSTSANESGKHFDREFCEAKADVVIEGAERLCERDSSKLIKLSHTKKKRLR